MFLRKNNLSGIIPHDIGNFSLNFFSLSLDSNQFSGNVPDELLNLINIKGIRLNNNKLISIPDLTPLTQLNLVKLESNKLTFEDLEPNVSIVINVYTYSPQDSVNDPLDTSLEIHSTINFKTSVGGINNQYQWYHNGLIVAGAIDSVYSISDFLASDTGLYTCRITNTMVTGLTLWRHLVHLQLGPVGINKLNRVDQCNIWVQKNVLHIEFNKELIEPLNVEVFLIDGRLLQCNFFPQRTKNAEILLPTDAINILLVKLHSNQTSITRLITKIK